ncbi:hypothetical protein PIB30_034229 [Stylosanthes scabra]|uniref:Uncharacterized protein n=1 Tax=Stylosanthes scabra TaxID=79078 RepID=A0ABU6UBG6_9FABA|nr:hypothetical protein [Stylosanthes scabra]
MAISRNHCRRFYCGGGSPTRRNRKASKTSTLIRLSLSLSTSQNVSYRRTNIRILKTVGLTTSPRSTFSFWESPTEFMDFFTQAYSLFSRRWVKGFQACAGGLSTSRLNSPAKGMSFVVYGMTYEVVLLSVPEI